MSGISNTLVLVPLREEMSYIHSRIIGAGAVLLQPVVFDVNQNDFIYQIKLSDNSIEGLQFSIMDRNNRDAMGNISTAAIASAIITADYPNIVFLVGLAGSVDSSTVRLGDVVVSSSAKFIAPDKIRKLSSATDVVVNMTGQQVQSLRAQHSGMFVIDDRKVYLGDHYFRFRRDVASCSLSTTRLAGYQIHLRRNGLDGLDPVGDSALAGLENDTVERVRNDNPRVHFGSILGGEWVVDSARFVDFLRERNDRMDVDYYTQKEALGTRTGSPTEGAKRNRWDPNPILAVDMESYGFLKSVSAIAERGIGLQAFTVRGISDLAAGKAELEKVTGDGVRKIAVHNAAHVAIDFILRLGEWNVGRRRL